MCCGEGSSIFMIVQLVLTIIVNIVHIQSLPPEGTDEIPVITDIYQKSDPRWKLEIFKWIVVPKTYTDFTICIIRRNEEECFLHNTTKYVFENVLQLEAYTFKVSPTNNEESTRKIDFIGAPENSSPFQTYITNLVVEQTYSTKTTYVTDIVLMWDIYGPRNPVKFLIAIYEYGQKNRSFAWTEIEGSNRAWRTRALHNCKTYWAIVKPFFGDDEEFEGQEATRLFYVKEKKWRPELTLMTEKTANEHTAAWPVARAFENCDFYYEIRVGKSLPEIIFNTPYYRIDKKITNTTFVEVTTSDLRSHVYPPAKIRLSEKYIIEEVLYDEDENDYDNSAAGIFQFWTKTNILGILFTLISRNAFAF